MRLLSPHCVDTYGYGAENVLGLSRETRTHVGCVSVREVLPRDVK